MRTSNIVLDKIKTIAAINVLEPVTRLNLSKSLRNNVNLELLPIILQELIQEGLIASEGNYYRVTRLGMSYLPSRLSKRLRDIHRMKYLLSTSKAKGRR